MSAIMPQPVERLATIRILAPLAILGFLSSRIAEAPEWIGDAGFSVPDLGDAADYHQPLYIPPLSPTLAWIVAALVVVAGLAVSAGFRTRVACFAFGALLFYVALADRLAAFTVSKLGPCVVTALAFTACGARYSADAWLARRRALAGTKKKKKARARLEKELDDEKVTLVPGGEVLFFQALLCFFYCGSGIAKARGDWLKHPYVLWTHLHDSYQTTIAWVIANHTPAWGWTVLQAVTLAYEVLAPIWFLWKRSRPIALAWGLAMHLMIGLMFGPVIWFSLLMMSLLLGSFAAETWLARALAPLVRRWGV